MGEQPHDQGVIGAARVIPPGLGADEGVAAGAGNLLAEVEAGRDARIELEAELSADRVSLAEIRSDLMRVHSQLDQVNAGIIGLQNHSLRQTGAAALILAVLVAVAWKVLEG